jgi:hypothetical protein
MEFMKPYDRHFAFALSFFAIALEIFDRKGGSAEDCGNSEHRRRVVLWKQTAHGEKQQRRT